MNHYLIKNTVRALIYYRKNYVTLIVIISVLCSVITGSLLTGDSVRTSLNKITSEKIGKTRFFVSSGLRLFNSSLTDRIKSEYKLNAVSVYETEGYCQNFATGSTALHINIFGINDEFFRFHGINDLKIEPGTIGVNKKLAEHLGVNEGDEIIIRFREVDPIPSNAPFASSDGGKGSLVMKVSEIVDPSDIGNFSLGINQIIPMNLYANLTDLQPESDSIFKVNRLLVGEQQNPSETELLRIIQENIIPSDIGLSVRRSEVTGESEIISDRIFIDSILVAGILNIIPEGYPVLTYLANSIRSKNSETPYSFICALPSSEYLDIEKNEIIINQWLSDDLGATEGSELKISWYEPSGKILRERQTSFFVKKILETDNKLSDPMLMPDFPGISGSTSCSSWDAGVPILMDKIRIKDEDYWDKFRGTPKAFISYTTGKKLWENNFGPATAIRFPGDIESVDILNLLRGKFDVGIAGFTLTDIKNLGKEAASQGVDFSTLFLSLGFFIIISALILLSLSLSMHFETKKELVSTLFALGFRNKTISGILFSETLMVSVAGAFIGTIPAFFVNKLIVYALNSVWKGAVQTDTIITSINLIPVFIGFISTVFISIVLVLFKLRSFLKLLPGKSKTVLSFHSSYLNKILLISSVLISSALVSMTFLINDQSVLISFSGGIFIFISLVLLLRHYYIGKFSSEGTKKARLYGISKQFYRFFPSHSVTPVIFIAAGIFAVIITSANHQVLSDEMLLNEGGTGGYLFWSESAIPVRKNLNSAEGKEEFGLNDNELSGMEIVQALRLNGDDASCLNLNHVKTPPVLGIDPSEFIRRNSFSFVTSIAAAKRENPWRLLDSVAGGNIIFGIADQTVLKWGLKINTGDTLVYMPETGKPLKIVICAGLESSVFQGHLIIGETNFRSFFPSIPGSSVYLIDSATEEPEQLKEILIARFSNFGFSTELASDKLASYFVVTNTYLNVFTMLGILGLIIGVAGLGLILIRNFEQRRSEFAFMMATGFSISKIKHYLLTDQMIILIWGIITGTLSALFATLPVLQNTGRFSPDKVIMMILLILFTGAIILLLSFEKVRRGNIISGLRRE